MRTCSRSKNSRAPLEESWPAVRRKHASYANAYAEMQEIRNHRDTVQHIYRIKRSYASHYKVIKRLNIQPSPFKDGNFIDYLTSNEYRIPRLPDCKNTNDYYNSLGEIMTPDMLYKHLLDWVPWILVKNAFGTVKKVRMTPVYSYIYVNQINQHTIPKYDNSNGIVNLSVDLDVIKEPIISKWFAQNPKYLVLRYELLEDNLYEVYGYAKEAVHKLFMYDFGTHISFGTTKAGVVRGAKKRAVNSVAKLIEA